MSVPGFWRRTLAGFVPASPEAEQVLARVKLGDVVKITVQRPRSLQWLRLYWGSLVVFIEENSSCSAKQVDALIKLRTGLVLETRERDVTLIQNHERISRGKEPFRLPSLPSIPMPPTPRCVVALAAGRA